MIFDSVFKDLPMSTRQVLEKRLETLILDLTPEKVADVKAVISLARALRVEIQKIKKK